MSTLQSYIHDVAQYGDRKIIVQLQGKDIDIKRLCHSLRHHLSNYVGRGNFRYAWFKTQQGITLLVSGNRIVADVVGTFLTTHSDAFQEHQILYCGRGIRIFEHTIAQELKHYDKSGRSFGATR